MSRQYLHRISAYLVVFLLIFSLIACKGEKSDSQTSENNETEQRLTAQDGEYQPFFKLSLAQWSVHKMIFDGELDPFDFPELAASWGFKGVEYVNQLYKPIWEEYGSKEEGVWAVVNRLKEESEAAGVENLIIMIDGEGDLAVSDEQARNQAVENHKLWVDAAAELGCHSIRINLFGAFEEDEWKANSIDAMTKLATYAKTKNVNVIVENHGWLSSNAPLLMEVINQVNMENAGTLPDFGNFCVTRKDGAKWGECLEEYPDIYQGVELMMQAAKAVSAKAYNFDAKGNETKIDYQRMLNVVQEAGYTGYIGIEYEGDTMDEKTGVMATKALLLNGGSFK